MQICKALFWVLLTSSAWLLTAKPYAILCILFGHRHYMYAPSQECLSCLCFIRPIAQWLANHPLFARPLAHKFYLIFDGKTLRNPMHFVVVTGVTLLFADIIGYCLCFDGKPQQQKGSSFGRAVGISRLRGLLTIFF